MAAGVELVRGKGGVLENSLYFMQNLRFSYIGILKNFSFLHRDPPGKFFWLHMWELVIIGSLIYGNSRFYTK